MSQRLASPEEIAWVDTMIGLDLTETDAFPEPPLVPPVWAGPESEILFDGPDEISFRYARTIDLLPSSDARVTIEQAVNITTVEPMCVFEEDHFALTIQLNGQRTCLNTNNAADLHALAVGLTELADAMTIPTHNLVRRTEAGAPPLSDEYALNTIGKAGE